MAQVPDRITVVAAYGWRGGQCWAYACHTCRRIGRPFFAKGAANLAATEHDCDNPKPYESTDVTGSDPVWAELNSSAWATLLSDRVVEQL